MIMMAIWKDIKWKQVVI